jgi:hypothetical protein
LDEIHCHDQDASGLRCCARPSASSTSSVARNSVETAARSLVSARVAIIR